MAYNFDETINRHDTGSVKYDLFEKRIIPLWVADMDFPAPDEIIQAMCDRLEHPIFGYTIDSPELRDIFCARMKDRYDWTVTPEQLVFIPGVVAGFNNAIRANAVTGGKFLIQPPIYPPMITANGGVGQIQVEAPLSLVEQGDFIRHEIDFDVFENAIDPDMRTFLLCNPHNPVGRVWTREELTRMAEICEKHDLMICSDEIHCDLIFEGHKHVPIASLSPEISKRTITLMAPSKTFNIPSLGFSIAIIQDETLRHKFQMAEQGVVPHVGVMGFTAGLAAYKDGDDWLQAVLSYLQANRDYVTTYITEHLPGVKVNNVEGTYLAWLDVRNYYDPEMRVERGEGLIEAIPEQFFAFLSRGIEPFFLKHAQVAMNNGDPFGTGGAGFARLNFAAPRHILEVALERMRVAIEIQTASTK